MRLAANGSPASEPEPINPDSVEMIFRVFSRRWAHKFEKTFSDLAARALWKRDLEILGVTDALINHGLHGSASLTWPPSPAEFAELCFKTPGIPPFEDAWSEAWALASKWKQPHECSHPVIWHAYANSDLDTDEESGRKRFLRNYQIASRMYATGGVDGLREIPKALPAKSVVPPSPEEIAATLRYADEKLAALGIGRRARS